MQKKEEEINFLAETDGFVMRDFNFEILRVFLLEYETIEIIIRVQVIPDGDVLPYKGENESKGDSY